MVKPHPSFLKSDADEMKRHKGELNYGTESTTQSDSTVRVRSTPMHAINMNHVNGLLLSLASEVLQKTIKDRRSLTKLRELWI